MSKKISVRERYPHASPRGVGQKRPRHSLATRLRATRLHLQEGYPVPEIAKAIGVHKHTVTHWIKLYKEFGEAGLKPQKPYPGSRKKRLPLVVHKKIVELKEEHPNFGVKKISHWLKRVFALPGSAETVRKTLHQKQLLVRKRRKPAHNPSKPRFFERTTPNQMWQTDIFSWRMNGHNAYLIGFIDDFSRYIVALGVARAQTTEHVMESYRRAVADYGAPKELLSDNGRQYASWQGKTKFQQELAKERVHHIRSAPHHPMTLGKIERFWKTIWSEFLERARFENFEEAQERIALWIKYYNHKRPHQSLEGMCPADRFFGIQHELRSVIEKTIEENILEQALGREPVAPFYMVGRLGSQSVVIRSEKGQVKMLIDPTQNQGESHGENKEDRSQQPQCPPESRSSAIDLDRATAAQGSDQTNGNRSDADQPVAEPRDERDAQGSGTQTDPGKWSGSEPASGKVACAQSDSGLEVNQARDASRKNPATQELEQITDGDPDECEPATSSAKSSADRPGPERTDQCERSCTEPRDKSKDLLQVGEAGPGSDGPSPESETERPARESDRSGEREAQAPEPGAGAATQIDGTEPEDPSVA